MRIAYVTIYDATTIERGFSSYNGVGYYLARALAQAGAQVEHLGPLRETFGLYYWAKQIFHRKFTHKTYNRHREKLAVWDYSRQVAARLRRANYDVVFSPLSVGSQPVAYLNCRQPIVICSDSTLASAVASYPALSWGAAVKSNLRAGLANERAALKRASLIIYPSEWAASQAISEYGLPAAKIKVVPWGANLECSRTMDDVQRMIDARPPGVCRLLFVGLDWERKGGPVVLATAQELVRMGLKVELNIVGCNPLPPQSAPEYVKIYGRLRRSVPEENRLFDELFSRSHLLMMPSKGEAFGHVFAEASSFGLPSIATNVGGIPSAVREGINGRLFPLETPAAVYARAIADLLSRRDEYRRLAIQSFNEYQTRLNWTTAGRTIVNLLKDLCSNGAD